MAFAFLNRFFGGPDPKDEWRILYASIVSIARDPHWYLAGGVADTIDGRFEMICLIASLVQMRIESFGTEGLEPGVRLTELLIDDLEGQIREIGFGDQGISKRMGELMSAVGGRLGAYRDGLAKGTMEDALVRNLYRTQRPDPAALSHCRGAVDRLHGGLLSATIGSLKAGQIRR